MNINIWKKQLNKLSGNLTTNEKMPNIIIEKILEEDVSLKKKIKFSYVNFKKNSGLVGKIKGLNILAGLQAIKKDGCLTVFRAVRFPTYKRIYDVITNKGYAISNYEQERILSIYKNKSYLRKRKNILKDQIFWTQPQERVVKGLPIFYLANDALQIHRAFRNEKDLVLMIAIHIPYKLIKAKKIKFISNPAIDLKYEDETREFVIKDYIKIGNHYEFDLEALKIRGIDLHEMYSVDLPWSRSEASTFGLQQDFFLLDIFKIKDYSKIQKLKEDSGMLKKNSYFLHGLFGDQNIFGRSKTSYLPYKCRKIEKVS